MLFRSKSLLRLIDLIEKSLEVAGALIQGLRGKVVGRIVECSVDALARGQPLLRGLQQACRPLERKKALALGLRKRNCTHTAKK